jgi:three-Cys-motif partner protein
LLLAYFESGMADASRGPRASRAEGAKPAVREALQLIWTEPLALDPSRRCARVTREIAEKLGSLAQLLKRAGHRPEAIAAFLMRALFTMFAEDVALLPKDSFLDLLRSRRARLETFVPMVEELWERMNTGGFSNALDHHVRRFNGNLSPRPTPSRSTPTSWSSSSRPPPRTGATSSPPSSAPCWSARSIPSSATSSALTTLRAPTSEATARACPELLGEGMLRSMSEPKQQFGGDWTSDKLERVRKYLVAYATIMHRKNFRFAYIDAFAGTGYNTSKARAESEEPDLFPELAAPEAMGFVDGSARIALKTVPRFNKYIFIEKDPKRFEELPRLREEFPDLASDIELVNADANAYLKDRCENRKWTGSRAVLFLDPFGMQVTWDTMQAIAKTKAIDLWILFPLGIAVNRLLRRDAEISLGWQRRLDAFFGEPDWRSVFYESHTETELFGEVTTTKKIADYAAISGYFVSRLKTIFPGVANNPLPLMNSANTPLYLLCFAAGNDKGAPTAVKIAQDILRR